MQRKRKGYDFVNITHKRLMDIFLWRLLTAVHDHIKDKTKVDYAALESKYKEFVDALYVSYIRIRGSVWLK